MSCSKNDSKLKNASHIPFHKPTFIGGEVESIQQAIFSGNWIKDSEDCKFFFNNHFPNSNCFLTNSCSSALELAVRALGIGVGDEIIIPAFGYVAAANAVVNNGARPVFADVLLFNGNLDIESVASCITPRTKAVIAIHYAGNALDIIALLKLCNQNHIFLIEDAAQCMSSSLNNKQLGSFGHLACLSFDYMKNISCGQGGLLIVNDSSFLSATQTTYDNGTNKKPFSTGEEKKFDWVSKGSNCQINPLASYFLSVQLKSLKHITDTRLKSWNLYYQLLLPLEKMGKAILPHPLDNHNGHIFYLITDSESQRNSLRDFLRMEGVYSEQHYSSLAKSAFGRQFANPKQSIVNSERLCSCLLRLPLWNKISEEEIKRVVAHIFDFYDNYTLR